MAVGKTKRRHLYFRRVHAGEYAEEIAKEKKKKGGEGKAKKSGGKNKEQTLRDGIGVFIIKINKTRRKNLLSGL